MRCGAGPLVVMAAVFWTQCVLLNGVDARKERKKPKEATPQQTETLNATISNSEEVGGSVKVVTSFTLISDLSSPGSVDPSGLPGSVEPSSSSGCVEPSASPGSVEPSGTAGSEPRGEEPSRN